MSVDSKEQQSMKTVGCVKWFNNKSGYGFVTIIDAKEESLKGRDIFAHHSSIKSTGDLYKYLVQGEYVEFTLQTMENKEHEYQASNITGIMSGDLMCETRFKNKDLSRVRDGFAPPRRVRTSDRNENGGTDRHRGNPHSRSREERNTES